MNANVATAVVELCVDDTPADRNDWVLEGGSLEVGLYKVESFGVRSTI